MKKAFDQTVRDLKRGVNKKVLKVPSIEQKVLDATSNESWGPHGSLLADIAQATRNYNEYQIIMSVVWRRTNDTGKNWRHVYKALTVLEYLVAHGSERVIDDIREHAYQISTLSDFQYIDSRGKDQGNNVRKKSQSLVVLVNDKERIQEVREKAAANRDKFRDSRPGNGDRYNDDRYEGRYGNRDDDRNGYGRDRDWGFRDDDRYGRHGDLYGREGERYGREYDGRNGRDGYRDDDYQGRGRATDEYNYNSRSKSVDRVRNPSNVDDGSYSSRGSGTRADDHSQDRRSSTGEMLDHKYSGQNLSAPPSYEDVVSASRSPTYSDRDGESSLPHAPKELSPPGASPQSTATTAAPNSASASPAVPPPAPVPTPAPSPSAVQSFQEVDGFAEFDPRGSFSAAPTTSSGTVATSGGEMDFLSSLSDPFSSNSLALVTASQPAMNPVTNGSAPTNSGPTFVASSSSSTISAQPFDDPFGDDGPFKAVPSNDGASSHSQITTTPTNNFNSISNVQQPGSPKASAEFGGTFHDVTYMPSGPDVQRPTTTQFSTPQLEVDILADILPSFPPSSFADTHAAYSVPPNQSVPHSAFPQTNLPASQLGSSSLTELNISQNSFQAQAGQPSGFPVQLGHPSLQTGYPHQSASSVYQTDAAQNTPLTFPVQAGQAAQMGFHSESAPMQQNTPNTNFYSTYNSASVGPPSAYMVPPNSTGHTRQQNLMTQSGSTSHVASQMILQAPHVQSTSNTAVSTNPLPIGSAAMVPQSSNDKFVTKSAIWADTLSRGLVNLNISGSKTNPNADIGVDFDAINRKEKRMEKPTTAAVTSTITMGKAMGSGSGIGRAGATALRAPPNPMMGPGMNIGIGGAPGSGLGMGGYGANQPIERGMGMGMGMMNMPGHMGMGPGMSIQQQQPMGFRGPSMPGGYTHALGMGNYGQQPYGGGYQ